jgi:hypothetical protein
MMAAAMNTAEIARADAAAKKRAPASELLNMEMILSWLSCKLGEDASRGGWDDRCRHEYG